MIRLWCAAVALMCLPLSAIADDAFVDWVSTSGPLPPEYAWSVNMTISAGGMLVLRHCKGYVTEGKDCTTKTATVPKAKLDAIRAAVTKADLAQRPMREMEMPPIGGSTVAAVVHMNGTKISVSGFPIEADADRVGPVLAAIYKAVPTRIAEEYIEGD